MDRAEAIHNLICVWLSQDEACPDLRPNEREGSLRTLRDCLATLGVTGEEFTAAIEYREGRREATW